MSLQGSFTSLQRSLRMLQIPGRMLEGPSRPYKDPCGSFRLLQRSWKILQFPAKILQGLQGLFRFLLVRIVQVSTSQDWSGFYKDLLGSYKDGSYPGKDLLGFCSNRFLQGSFRSQQRFSRCLFSFIKDLRLLDFFYRTGMLSVSESLITAWRYSQQNELKK